METMCTHPNYKFLCKDCVKYLCDKCKLEHPHTNIIEISFFNSFVKFEVENLKVILNELEIFQSFEEQVGLKPFIYKLREFYSTLVDEKLNLNGLVKGQNLNLRDLIFNAKILLNEESNMTTKDDAAYLEFYKKFQDLNKSCSGLNSIIEKISKSFDTFNNVMEDYGKYKEIKKTKNEQNLIKNHSNFIENLAKEKEKDKTAELNEKIKLLESENEKIMEMNKKLSEEMKQLTAINNKFYNVEGKIIENEKYDAKKEKRYLEYYKDDLNSLMEKMKGKLLTNSLQLNQFEEIDKIEIKSLIRTNFDSLLASMNQDEFKFLNFDPSTFKTFLVNKKIVDDICESEIFKNIIDKVKVILANEIIDSIYENKENIFKQLQLSLYAHYLKNSKKIKLLKAFDFKNSQIEDKDMQKISEVINCSKVSDVYLQNNLITDVGALQFFENLRENKIKTIYLNNNSLTEKTIKRLVSIMSNKAKYFGNLKILSFENNRISESQVKESLREIKKTLKITIYI